MFGFSSDQKLDKIVEKIEEFAKDTDRRLDNLEKVAIANDLHLQEHMKRSDALEMLIKLEEENRKKELEAIHKNQQKTVRHVSMVEGAFKLLGVLSILIGIVVGLVKIFSA